MKAGITALVIVLALPASGRSADDAVDIDFTPSTCVAPCSVRVSIRVPVQATNRTVTITADSPDFYRSSTRQLDRDGGPRYHEVVLDGLPAGDYEVRVTVDRSGAADVHGTRTFRVHDDAESMRRTGPAGDLTTGAPG